MESARIPGPDTFEKLRSFLVTLFLPPSDNSEANTLLTILQLSRLLTAKQVVGSDRTPDMDVDAASPHNDLWVLQETHLGAVNAGLGAAPGARRTSGDHVSDDVQCAFRTTACMARSASTWMQTTQVCSMTRRSTTGLSTMLG